MMPPEIDTQTAEWLTFVNRVREDPAIGFDEQWARFVELSDARDPGLGPLPTWVPDAATVESSNLGRFMAELEIGSYDELHRWSTTCRGEFWESVIARLGIVGFRTLLGNTSHPPDVIAGRRVLVSAGVGDPESLADQCAALGARTRLLAWPDHHRYTGQVDVQRPQRVVTLHAASSTIAELEWDRTAAKASRKRRGRSVVSTGSR